ncbi:Protein of unknown function [Bacillus mobilis]
MADKS